MLDAFTMWSGRFLFVEREGECHIALFSAVDPYRELRCSDWTPVVQSPGQLDVNWVGPRLPDGVIAIRDGTFGILDAARGRFTPATTFLGPNLGDVASMVVPLAVTATTAEYAVAHDGVVERVRIASARLFSDTFGTGVSQP